VAEHDQPSKRVAREHVRPYRNKDGTVQGDRLYHGKTINTTVSLYEGDHELLDYLTEFLGTNRSDAIRSAIRSFAAMCQQIERRQRR
jgi:hypothetical protein